MTMTNKLNKGVTFVHPYLDLEQNFIINRLINFISIKIPQNSE